MFGRECFCEIGIEGPEGENLMVWRPAIADNGCIVAGNDLKSIGAIRINCPETPVAQEGNFVPAYMPRATASYSGSDEQEQQNYEITLMFHERTIALWVDKVKRVM